ncbi:MAG: AAA family ATPase, partial [Planctomycetia bacterium]
GGRLTEAVRRRPYSVLLLDEVEKAHLDVFNILLQVFDDGRLTDGHGRTVDFRNTVVIMTSNIGSQIILDLAGAEEQEMRRRVTEALRSHFLPEFLNRIDDVVIFHNLDRHQLHNIVRIQLNRLEKQLSQMELRLHVTDRAVDALAREGYDPVYGARPLKRLIQNRLQNPLATELLEGRHAPGSSVTVDFVADGFVFRTQPAEKSV